MHADNAKKYGFTNDVVGRTDNEAIERMTALASASFARAVVEHADREAVERMPDFKALEMMWDNLRRKKDASAAGDSVMSTEWSDSELPELRPVTDSDEDMGMDSSDAEASFEEDEVTLQKYFPHLISA